MSDELADKKAVLQSRAAAIAKEAPIAPCSDGRIELIVFALGEERFAVERAFVKEVQPLRGLTPLPGTPAHIAGIVNIRGQVVAVMALKRLFGIPERNTESKQFCIVVEADGARFGIAADGTTGLLMVPKDQVEETLPTLAATHSEYVKGITTDHIVILDAERLINSPGILVDHEPKGIASAGAHHGQRENRSRSS